MICGKTYAYTGQHREKERERVCVCVCVMVVDCPGGGEKAPTFRHVHFQIVRRSEVRHHVLERVVRKAVIL
jgi:hypothetical protein